MWGGGGGGEGRCGGLGEECNLQPLKPGGAERIGERLCTNWASCVFPQPLGVRSECCHLQIIQVQDHGLTPPRPSPYRHLCTLERKHTLEHVHTLDAQRQVGWEASKQPGGRLFSGRFIPSWFHLN